MAFKRDKKEEEDGTYNIFDNILIISSLFLIGFAIGLGYLF